MNNEFQRQELIHTGKANNVYATNFEDYLELEWCRIYTYENIIHYVNAGY